MTKQPFLHEEAFLGESAIMLLASSSLNRYVRIAKTLATASPLRLKLEGGRLTIQDLLIHADSLWRRILNSRERDLPEVELAVILPIVADLATDEAADLLIRVSMQDQVPAAWISALARHLFQQRATNEEFLGPKATSIPIDVARPAVDANMVKLRALVTMPRIDVSAPGIRSKSETLTVAA